VPLTHSDYHLVSVDHTSHVQVDEPGYDECNTCTDKAFDAVYVQFRVFVEEKLRDSIVGLASTKERRAWWRWGSQTLTTVPGIHVKQPKHHSQALTCQCFSNPIVGSIAICKIVLSCVSGDQTLLTLLI
jgi:hypothetical protein